jgi:type I restriction enzyme S subunit
MNNKITENTIEEFKIIVENSFDKIKSNQQQIHTLEKMRDTLLPKLMSGEVKVLIDA